MNRIYLGSEGCCGCAACSIICPRNAIQMHFNEYGEYTSIIDGERCAECHLCEKICPMMRSENSPISKKDTFVAACKDLNILNKSSSGGIAYVLARKSMELGLPLCGVCYDESQMCAKHIVTDKEEELTLLQGSKYLQSVNEEAFKEIIERKKGLVVGTPCQIAGIDLVLRQLNIRNNYYLIDIFCHGVPLQNIWINHLQWLKKRNKIHDFSNVTFREGKNFILSINKYKAWYNEDAFYTFFLKGEGYMRQCYSCKYRRHSSADIRIGDLALSKFKDLDYNPSVVVVNTEMGWSLLKECKRELIMFKEEYSEIDKIQEKENRTIPSNYTDMINQLIAGKYPDEILHNKLRIGRIKSIIKHVILEKMKRKTKGVTLEKVMERYGKYNIFKDNDY